MHGTVVCRSTAAPDRLRACDPDDSAAFLKFREDTLDGPTTESNRLRPRVLITIIITTIDCGLEY